MQHKSLYFICISACLLAVNGWAVQPAMTVNSPVARSGSIRLQNSGVVASPRVSGDSSVSDINTARAPSIKVLANKKPTSVSNSGTAVTRDLMERIEKLEDSVAQKQDKLSGDDYITVSDDGQITLRTDSLPVNEEQVSSIIKDGLEQGYVSKSDIDEYKEEVKNTYAPKAGLEQSVSSAVISALVSADENYAKKADVKSDIATAKTEIAADIESAMQSAIAASGSSVDAKLEGYATIESVENAVGLSEDAVDAKLEGYAKSTDVTDAIATAKTEIADDIESAKQSAIAASGSSVDEKLADYVTNVDVADALKGYAKSEDLSDFVTADDLKGFASAEDLEGLAGQVQGVLTGLPSDKPIVDVIKDETEEKLTEYAKSTDVENALRNYVTTEELGYLVVDEWNVGEDK